MKRKVGTMVFLAAACGWGGSAAWGGTYMSRVWNTAPDGGRNGAYLGAEAPNLVGPYGQPVPIIAPASYNPQQVGGADYARAMLAQSFPADILQMAGAVPAPAPGMPGIGGPGPALPLSPIPGGLRNPPGAVAAVGALTGPGAAPFGVSRTEIRFVGPAGMRISWYAPQGDGHVGFTSRYLEAPARYNFLQASIYRLKLADIPNRPGVELYPTLEVVPANMKTATFLAHSAVPVAFTEEDLEQVAAGNFVVKVIYLPDPAFQDLAATGPDEVVSSRLEPGVDPIIEAKRRGSILAIIRLGNIDLEAPNTPSMDAPGPGGPPKMPFGPGMGVPGMPGLGMMPPGMTAPNVMLPRPPGAPAMPATSGVPSAPTVPTPFRPGTPSPGAPR
jgi:hypothetical protein